PGPQRRAGVRERLRPRLHPRGHREERLGRPARRAAPAGSVDPLIPRPCAVAGTPQRAPAAVAPVLPPVPLARGEAPAWRAAAGWPRRATQALRPSSSLPSEAL